MGRSERPKEKTMVVENRKTEVMGVPKKKMICAAKGVRMPT